MARRYTGGFLSAKEQATDSNTANGVFSLADVQEKTALGNFPTGRWTPQRSLRFRASANAWFTKSPSTASNQTTWTWSGWVKFAVWNSDMALWHAGSVDTNRAALYWQGSTGQLIFGVRNSNVWVHQINTNASFRDPSAWYHVVCVFDTNNANSADRSRIYVNGVRQLVTISPAASSGLTSYINSTDTHSIGVNIRFGAGTNLDGYMSELNFVDGQALDASYFGYSDPETGAWVPKRYTGTYGTNGYYMPFSDNTSAYALGKNFGTGTNILTYSNAFTTAPWATQLGTLTANAATDPFGGSTAWRFKEDSSAGQHLTYVSGWTNGNGDPFTFSCYLKDDGTHRLVSLTSWGGDYPAFDLQNGKVIYTGTGYRASMQSAGNGWWRCTISGNFNQANSSVYVLPVDGSVVNAGNNYTGNNTSGYYLYGAQLEFGSQMTPYVATSGTGVLQWGPNNFSLTAGYTYDSSVDVPGICNPVNISVTGDPGGVTRGNYPTLNAVGSQYQGNSFALSDANSHITIATCQNGSYVGSTQYITRGDTNKYYFESYQISKTTVGGDATCPLMIYTANDGTAANQSSYPTGNTTIIYQGTGGAVSTDAAGGSVAATTGAISNGDTVMLAVDAAAGTWWFGKNGTWHNGGNPATGANPTGTGLWRNGNFVTVGAGNLGGNMTNFQCALNFGSRPFTYTAPVGFKTLCTTNLPNPVIKRSTDHFDVKLWTGTGTDQIVGKTNKQISSYKIAKSFRSRASATSNLTRTLSATQTSRQKMTFSGWFKLGATGTTYIFNAKSAPNTVSEELQFGVRNNVIRLITCDSSNNGQFVFDSNQYHMDTTQWHHIMFALDSTNSIAQERVKVYIDGVKLAPAPASTYPAQNINFGAINTGIPHNIGYDAYQTGSNSADFYATEVYFVDGQQLDPSNFGSFDANNNWVPKQYTGTYGLNGFYLPMNYQDLYLNTATSSTYAWKFNAASVSLPSAAGNLGTGDWTVECFYRSSGAGNTYSTFISKGITGTPANGAWSFGPRTASSAAWFAYYNGGFVDVTGTQTDVLDGSWHHMAASRSGTALRLFVDGTLVATATLPANFDFGTALADNTLIGYNSRNAAYIAGELSNLRIVTGTALYTGTNIGTKYFTVPTSALTAISGTKLLIGNTNSYTDSSTNNYTVTGTSGAGITQVFPFRNTTFNTYASQPGLGSNNHILIPATSNLEFGAGDFTIELWWWAGSTNRQAIYHGSWGTDWSVGIDYNGTGAQTIGIWASSNGTGWNLLNADAGGNGVGSIVIKQNQWNHIVYQRSGTTWSSYINGVRDKNITGLSGTIVDRSASQKVIGNWWNTTAMNSAGGYMSNFRITKGTALYSGASFIPPKNTLTASAGTQLLTLQDPVIVDNSANAYALSLPNGLTTTTAFTFANSVGNDASGNTNCFTVFPTQTQVDVTNDVPTDYDDNTSFIPGGNFAVLNYNDKGSVVTVSESGLKWAQSTTTAQAIRATLPMLSGKWYWETNGASNMSPGILKQSGSISTYVGGDAKGWSYFVDGTLYNNGTNAAYGSTFGSSDIIGVAFDADTGKLWFSKNGTWQASGNPATGVNPAVTVPLDQNDPYYPAFSTSVSGAVVGTVTFGATPFSYAPPTGFKALNTKNLKDVGAYNLPDSTGNFVNTPDLVWMKARNIANWHFLYDTVRGPGARLMSNTPNYGQSTEYTTLTKFLPYGFEVGTDGVGGVNTLGTNHVGWCWNRGQLPGFDIVQYAGDGNGTRVIQHNLGQTPSMIIVKSVAGTQTGTAWRTKHKSLATNNNIDLGSSGGPFDVTASAGGGIGDQMGPTTFTVVSGTTNANNVNENGTTYIAYLWAEVPGFSRFGSYVGNGSTGDGPYIYTGFRPKYFLLKRADATAADWWTFDSARNTYNPVINYLRPDLTDIAGDLTYGFDFLSNAVKIKDPGASLNTSGVTFIYAAFAEAPFKYANAR